MRKARTLAATTVLFLIVGCGGGDSTQLDPSPAKLPEITIGPNPLEFGNVTVGDQLGREILIANTGQGPLDVMALTLTGSPQFALAPTAPPVPFSVDVGATVSVLVSYTPVGAGLVEGELRVESDAANLPIVTVAVSGSGTLPPPVTTQAFTMLRLAGGAPRRYDLNLADMNYTWFDVIPGGPGGAGTLTPLAGAQDIYELSEDGSTLILERDRMAVLGDGTTQLAVGVPPRTEAYVPSEIAGMYNFVAFVGSLPFSVTIGTLQIEENGAWRLWYDGNGTTLGASQAWVSGVWVDRGDGTLELTAPVDQPDWAGANLLLRTEGAETAIVMTDMTLPRIWLGVRQRALPTGIDGTYDAIGYQSGGLYTLELLGTSVTPPVGGDTIVKNAPWTGFAMSVESSGAAITWNYFLFGTAGLAFGGGERTDPLAMNGEGWIWAALK